MSSGTQDHISKSIMESFLLELKRAQSQQEEVVTYYIIEETDAEPNKLHKFSAKDEFITKLKELNTRKSPKARVFLFSGKQLFLSKSNPRYLLLEEEKIPLFDLPDQLEPDESGNLGEEIKETTPITTESSDLKEELEDQEQVSSSDEEDNDSQDDDLFDSEFEEETEE